MDEVWNEMTDISERVQHFREDFKQDKKIYDFFPDKTPMVWMVRDCGTYLLPLKDIKIYGGMEYDSLAIAESSRENRSDFYYLEKNRFINKISYEQAVDYLKKREKMTLDNFPKGKVINVDSQKFVSVGNRSFLHIYMSKGASVPLATAVSMVRSDKMLEYCQAANKVSTDDMIFYKHERSQLQAGRVIPKNPRSLTLKDQKTFDKAEEGTRFLQVVTPNKIYLFPEVDITCGSGMAGYRQHLAGEGAFYSNVKGNSLIELSPEESSNILYESRAKALEELAQGSLITASEEYSEKRTVYALKMKDKIAVLKKDGDMYQIDSVTDYHGLDDIRTVKAKKFFSKMDMERLSEGKAVEKRSPKTIVVDKKEGQERKI